MTRIVSNVYGETEDVDPWTISIGSPVRVPRECPKGRILEMEKRLREQYK
jgi:hypothetical protein